MFFDDDYVAGFEDAKTMMLEILDKTAEPVGNFDKLTLRKLAKKLRKVFRFDVLTYSVYEDNYYKKQKDEVVLWARIPYMKLPEYDKERGAWLGDVNTLALIRISNIRVRIEEILDLSEYADENGNIDYSRCIVEVE